MRAHKEDGTMTTFVERLKALREGRHLSQRELAYQAGLSKSLISMLESGAREPRTEHLEALADFFNVDIDYLLGRSDQTTILDPERLFVQQQFEKHGILFRKIGRLSDEDAKFVEAFVDKLLKEEQ